MRKIIDVPAEDIEVIESQPVSTTALARVEVDSQITTAKQFPRDMARFTEKAASMVESHMALAKRPEDGLGYALPRGGKIIQGPNARFAEIVAHCWGNLRISRDLISEEAKHVVCESICHDLESNNAERVRVRRRITNRDGHRYDDDMITVTANAGASIARRNAVLAVIPKAQWWPLYERSLKLAGGESKKEVSTAAKSALAHFAKLGITEAKVLSTVGVRKAFDLTSEHVATLRGIASAIASGETTAHKAFNGGEEDFSRKSAIKEKPKVEGPVTKEQIGQAWSLVADLNLESTEMAVCLKELGHSGRLNTLSASKFDELITALKNRKA